MNKYYGKLMMLIIIIIKKEGEETRAEGVRIIITCYTIPGILLSRYEAAKKSKISRKC